ncbi:MAG: family 16 glycosylhydrolase [Paludibacteraceae bacterium]|nr:family 16 glycosylhydrolase [Paludibacteraceae bacterium]
MNLFWKKLFGGLTSTEKFEKQIQEQFATYQRYKEVAQSAELKEYMQLREIVKTASFKENKKQLQNRKYKDTEEGRNWINFQRLQNNGDFKRYLHTLQSDALAEYQAFQQSPDYIKLADKKAVASDAHLKKMYDFEHSKEYKNFTRFKGSAKAGEYERLKALVETEDFKKRNAFWQNEHRWETTEESKQDARYYALSKNPDIVFFESRKADDFKDVAGLEERFVENFDNNTLSNTRWQFGFHYRSAQLKGNHSFANEQQANNEGKNTSVSNGTLQLQTRQQTVTASAWDVRKGFVDKQFDYTSDVMQTSGSFCQQGGVFRAKLRCTGHIHHALWLGADNMLPHVNIFHYNGKNITLGNASANMMDEEIIKGINPNQYYIYTLVWTNSELVWYINNLEVFRTATNVPHEEMYIALNSFIAQTQAAQPGLLEVDWIKAYAVKG